MQEEPIRFLEEEKDEDQEQRSFKDASDEV